MVAILRKGEGVSLEKLARNITIGLGWKARKTSDVPFDLDASAFMLAAKDKVPHDVCFIFYNNPRSPDSAVIHLGDDRTGAHDDGSDQEQITIDLERVDKKIKKIVFVASIHKGAERKQNFGLVQDAYIRVLTGRELDEHTRFNLTSQAGSDTAMIFGELRRSAQGLFGDTSAWEFMARGQGVNGGLKAICEMYGVEVVS